ncbi:Uncharacterised protein [Mycobacteroides abscessus subsp. abscessus]|nr:Uncharacterised protein [Mycobacteroides abscessus subsp. abscessus]SKT68500.1 Uncharacterised protein [Mycobacteroides abscessus subsp. abscessus]
MSMLPVPRRPEVNQVSMTSRSDLGIMKVRRSGYFGGSSCWTTAATDAHDECQTPLPNCQRPVIL